MFFLYDDLLYLNFLLLSQIQPLNDRVLFNYQQIFSSLLQKSSVQHKSAQTVRQTRVPINSISFGERPVDETTRYLGPASYLQSSRDRLTEVYD